MLWSKRFYRTKVTGMDNLDSFTGLPAEVDDEAARRWARLIVKILWPVIVIGVLVGIIFWVTASSETGRDIGALCWCITFGASVALLSIRQAVLAERR